MLLNRECQYTPKELRSLSEKKFFDRITVVTSRIETVIRNLSEIYGLTNWKNASRTHESLLEMQTVRNGKLSPLDFSEKSFVATIGDVELCLVQPEFGNTACMNYLQKYFEGICCVRENIPADRWEDELSRYETFGIRTIQKEQDETGRTAWLDTLDTLGGMLALHVDSEKRGRLRKNVNKRRLSQINIVTNDVNRTVSELTTLLRIGPWSIGTLNNQTVSDPGILVDGIMTAPEFHFQLGITFYSNIEFEVIQPINGPTVYRDFLKRHGCGFHHIKEVIPPSRWKETLERYQKMGVRLSMKGRVGPTRFAYLDSEKLFDFVVELGDGIPADPLPDGYNEYQYPSS